MQKHPSDKVIHCKQWAEDNGFNYRINLNQSRKNAKGQKLTFNFVARNKDALIEFAGQFYTSDLPSEAITIFYDAENLYEYVSEHCTNPQRVQFNPLAAELKIVNILVIKSKERAQQVTLSLSGTELPEVQMEEEQEIAVEQKPSKRRAMLSEKEEERMPEEEVSKSVFGQNNQSLAGQKMRPQDQHSGTFDSTIEAWESAELASSKSGDMKNGPRNAQNVSTESEQQLPLMMSRIEEMSSCLKEFISEMNTVKLENQDLRKLARQHDHKINRLEAENASLLGRVAKNEELAQRIASTQDESWPGSGSRLSSETAHSQEVKELRRRVEENKWHIDQLNYSLENIKESNSALLQNSKVDVDFQNKSAFDDFSFSINEKLASSQEIIKDSHENLSKKHEKLTFVTDTLHKQVTHIDQKLESIERSLEEQYKQHLQPKNRLGQKIHLSIDRENQYLSENFRIIENVVEKISGDETRHQILFNQILSRPYKSHFEIRLLTNEVNVEKCNILIGFVVGKERRGHRYSYDKKECICYDGKGWVFEQGQKIKMGLGFANGQTIRAAIDPLEKIIQWYVGYTQIGSVPLPQSMESGLVPYLEMYDVGDRVLING